MICPIMTTNFFGKDEIESAPMIADTNVNGFVECQKEKCAWWVGLMEVEGEHKNGYVYRCAIAQLAMKQPDGTNQ